MRLGAYIKELSLSRAAGSVVSPRGSQGKAPGFPARPVASGYGGTLAIERPRVTYQHWWSCTAIEKLLVKLEDMRVCPADPGQVELPRCSGVPVDS